MNDIDRDDRDDRGVATIFLILTMTAILVGAALAIDVGGYVAAARSAQNSADATVMAVATDCALHGAPIADYSPYRKDGQTITTPVCGAGEATITVTKEVDGLLLQQSAGDVSRRAVARWGTVNSATTIPVVISQCTFDLATANGTTFPSAEVIIPLGSGGPDCPGRPPGAFGWVDSGLSGPCSMTTTLDASGQLVVHGTPGNGNGPHWNCITAVGVNGTITIPIYGASCRDPSPCVVGQNNGVGNNNYYLILGFAEIQVTGWKLQHGSPNQRPAGAVPSCPGPGSASCIRGRFVRFTTQAGSTGPASDFGVQQIYLSD